MACSLADRVAPAPDVLVRLLGDEAVVVNLEGGLYFGLDAVGARIWTLSATNDLAGVAAALTREFEVDRARAEADVLDFVSQLVNRGLLIRVSDD